MASYGHIAIYQKAIWQVWKRFKAIQIISRHFKAIQNWSTCLVLQASLCRYQDLLPWHNSTTSEAVAATNSKFQSVLGSSLEMFGGRKESYRSSPSPQTLPLPKNYLAVKTWHSSNRLPSFASRYQVQMQTLTRIIAPNNESKYVDVQDNLSELPNFMLSNFSSVTWTFRVVLENTPKSVWPMSSAPHTVNLAATLMSVDGIPNNSCSVLWLGWWSLTRR